MRNSSVEDSAASGIVADGYEKLAGKALDTELADLTQFPHGQLQNFHIEHTVCFRQVFWRHKKNRHAFWGVGRDR